MDGSVWSVGNYSEGKKQGEFIYYGFGNKNIYSKKKAENYKNGILEGQIIHYF
jgi:antitoxin component YwqK of YwqJK toxin-antitoxin module